MPSAFYAFRFLCLQVFMPSGEILRVFFALPIQIFSSFWPRCPVSAAAIPFLSTETAFFVDRRSKMTVLSTETALFVDRRLEMMVLFTETAFFVDRKCLVLKRGGVLSTAARKTGEILAAVL